MTALAADADRLPCRGATDRKERGYPLVIGYHRPPVHPTPDGWRPPRSPNGILPVLSGLSLPGRRAVWVTAAVGADRPETDMPSAGLPLSPLTMSPNEWTGFVHRACKEALWPVLMSQPERMRFDPAAWRHYRAANARFAAHIGALAAKGATVWLHEYNLWLVPGMLRAARSDLRIGLFHHTPFPAPDVFAALPTAAEIRASLACLDWSGLHTQAFADNFRRALVPRSGLPRIEVHPLGVDRGAIEALVGTRPRLARVPGEVLVLSVERLDYVKAPVEKVEAIDTLLARVPRLRGRLKFRLICPPPEAGITAYDETGRVLERRVADVNRCWRTDVWQPIEYLPRCLPFAEIIDHYLAADVFWVTSLQDGMNLTAKEFIAAQAAVAGCGVLVLSRNAGAAAELGTAALLTDPGAPDDLVGGLRRALDLTWRQRRDRLHRLSHLLGDRLPADWATDIIAAISATGGGMARGRRPCRG